MQVPSCRFVMYADLPFTKFHVRNVLSLLTDSAILPLGCTLRLLAGPLKKT